MNEISAIDDIKLNTPSLYLQDISKKRDSIPDSLHWIFFHFLLTPRIMYDYTVFSINRSKNRVPRADNAVKAIDVIV